MFCPHCGQQQVTGVVRFCSRCGFPLDGVMQLLENRGMIPVYNVGDEHALEMSARRRGVRQGVIMFLSGLVLVPLLGILASYAGGSFFEMLTAFAAIICFVGGIIRMLYAAVFEEGAQNRFRPATARPFASGPMPQPQFGSMSQHAALPPPPVQSMPSWRSRPTTAELSNRPSVTENTTRLLDKDERPER